MMKHFKEFLRDEDGAVTVEFVVVIGGTVTMVTRLMLDISVAVASLASMTGDFLSSDHLADMLFRNQFESSYSASADGGSTDSGTATGADTGAGTDSGTGDNSGTDGTGDNSGTDGTDGTGVNSGTGGTGDGSTSTGGNPGNGKDVGNAGENPNGKGGWGSTDKGKSQ